MKRTIRIAAACVALCMTAGSFSGCYFFPEEEKLLDPPVLKVEDVAYSTYKAVKKTLVNRAATSGYVVSRMQENCTFTEDGNIKKIYVKAGDTVKKGDLIAEYSTGDLEYRLRNQELTVQKAQLNYNSSGSESDRLQLEMEQNTLDQLQHEYDCSRIFAPADGLVSFTEHFKPGESVKAYKIVATIVDPEDLYIKANVNEDKKFTKGQDVTITIDEEDFDGTVIKTPVEAKEEGDDDTSSIYVEFKGTLPSFTKISTVADISYIKDQAEDAIVIPKYLVKTLSGQDFVEVFKDGVKTEVQVELGISNATEVQVLSGLSEGDEVVVK